MTTKAARRHEGLSEKQMRIYQSFNWNVPDGDTFGGGEITYQTLIQMKLLLMDAYGPPSIRLGQSLSSFKRVRCH